MKEVKHKPPFELPRANIIDRTINYFNPEKGVRRMKSRVVMALGGAYYGGSKRRRALSEWIVSAGDADSDISFDLPTLRERSRDLVRNNPLACGAIKTKTTSIVGTGLTLKSTIDRDILELDEEVADAWENKTEAEWRLWADKTDCDVEDTLNFSQIQELCVRSVLENGDTFILTPMKTDKRRTYSLQLQMIEADRVCNKNSQSDSVTLSGGIERSEFGGAPVKYHILKGHPGNIWSKNNEWQIVDGRGSKTGRKNVLHLFHKIRIGQSRGVPDLAPVIESLKQLGTYSKGELDAAVVSSFFTVFVKSELGGADSLFNHNLGPMQPTSETGAKTSDKDYKMASAAILDLAPGEDVEFANPSRPNQAFDQFILAMSRQIGVALELPFEILVKHFTASYSAARAALLEAWKFYMSRRKWLADVLCKPVYELWMTEAVATGRISAPGFLSGDPLIRDAYLGSEWIGPAKGSIDEVKEVGAAEKRVNMGISTLDEETKSLTGGNWEKKHRQRVKEVEKRKEGGLESGGQKPPGGDQNQNNNDSETPDQSSEEQKG